MKHFKGNTLLIELMIVLLFFALSQAIILQVFASAQQTNRTVSLRNAALMQAQNTAEFLAVATTDAETALLSLGYTADSDALFIADHPSEGYQLTAQISRFTQPSGVLTTVTITARQEGRPLFTLPAVRYQGVRLP